MSEVSVRILRPKMVRAKLQVGNTWLWEQVKRGNFPQPIPLGARAVGFLESEIDAWIAARVQTRRGAQQGGSDVNPL